ncbi:L,D-transpeptidase family protein [Thiocapsa rosea]|uniref:Murein L,D-transpeptidase YcbB/YkuD n=1 Tax=Thiocapsa rosea TaxID=69360 RepID=A0A495VBY8_9GAMM|nr:L,D-transpeptidase family protein [Thiocapsa rosea]RKT46906.1 murein L,D-transpeptidase YcbB/YkuD [Thiocapsa rosea]
MRFRLVGLMWFSVVVSGPAFADGLLRPTLDSIRDARTVAVEGVPLLSGRLLAEFYAQRGDVLVWVEPAPVSDLLDLAQRSVSEGFRAEDFHVEYLRRLAAPGALESLTGNARLAADLVLSDALARYVHHHRYGKLDPVAVDSKWHDRSPASSEVILADMTRALDGNDLAGSLSEHFSRPFWYEDLKKALQRYTAQTSLVGLAPLPAGSNLARGSRHARVAMLRERLARIEGAAVSEASDIDLFDTALHEAVVSFQRRSGLAADGVVGPATLAALNGHGDETKAEQIRINLERMRWLYHDLPEDYVFVDVAAFKAHLARGGSFVWSTRVIVGTPETQTLMFRDTMDHLVFNPTWTVPVSIQKKMGRVSSDYRLVDRRTGRQVGSGNAGDYARYRLVQAPGPKNALGRVKFMFPNRHAIYLHDTPGKAAFARQARALSNGCVRVQDPLDLAEALLDQPNWDRSGIERVVERGRTRYVDLADTLPVLLYYLTAFADGQGQVGFRQDIYGRDEALRTAFSNPVLRTRISFPEPADESPNPSPNPNLSPTMSPETPERAPDSDPPDPSDNDKDTSVRLTGRGSTEGHGDEPGSGTDGSEPAVSTLDRPDARPTGRL